MTSVKVKSKCLLCGYKVTWTCYTNEYGFFSIPDAFCPNDLMQLDQEIDGKEIENKQLWGKCNDNQRGSS